MTFSFSHGAKVHIFYLIPIKKKKKILSMRKHTSTSSFPQLLQKNSRLFGKMEYYNYFCKLN